MSTSMTESGRAHPPGWLDPTEYTTERAVADLEAVQVHIGAPRVVLHGHSWGALFAVAYAQEHPDRVAALVLSGEGIFVACTSSRYNDPEFANVLPNWGESFSFDSRDRARDHFRAFQDHRSDHVGQAGCAPR